VSRHCTSGSHYFRHTAFISVCLKMGCLKFDDHHFPLPLRTNFAQSIFIHFPTHDLSRLDLRPCVFSYFSYAFPPVFFSWFSNASVTQVGLAAKPQIAKAQHGAVSPMDHRLQGNLAAMVENPSGMASIFPQILDKPHLFLAELQDPSNQPPSLRLTFGSYDFWNSSFARRQLTGNVEDLVVEFWVPNSTPQLYKHMVSNLTCDTCMGRIGRGPSLRKPTLLAFEQRPARVVYSWICVLEISVDVAHDPWCIYIYVCMCT
jgi:hypothetical protein